MGLGPSKADRLRTEIFNAVDTGQLDLLTKLIGKIKDLEERKKLTNHPSKGGTILHGAAFHGRVNIIKWILSERGGRAAGIDGVLAKTPFGFSALYIAAVFGRLEACKAIVNGCRVENGEREWMLNVTNNDGWTVLHCAANRSHPDVVRWLLSSEEGGGALGFVSVLARTTDNSTALHYAGNLETFLAVVDGCRVENGERAEMLNSVDGYGCTILHRAASGSYPKIISWLLSEKEGGGAAAGFDRNNVTALSKTGSSVLHLAATSSAECIQVLLSHCTQQERMNLFLAVDKHGWTALYSAAQKNYCNCVKELLQHPECTRIANRKDKLGMTALHRVIIGGLDEESSKEWTSFLAPDFNVVAALLGSSETGWTSIDPNVGLGTR